MRLEVISTVERRRHWSAAEKVRILNEASQPGANVSAVAGAHGICRSLIYLWRRQIRDGAIPGVAVKCGAPPVFAPVRIAAPDKVPAPGTGAALTPPSEPPANSGRVEIALPNGLVVRVEAQIDPAALTRIIGVLERPC